MQNMPDQAQLMQMIQSPEGQKLLALLRSTDSNALSAAIAQFRSGNLESAKRTLSQVLDDDEIKPLLNQLGR